MQKIIYAVLIDITAIQKYIYSTNRLKENLGASFLVEDIYDSHLKAIINDMFPSLGNSFYEEWENNPSEIKILNSADFEIGYIGGGNALLFFKYENNAKEFIKQWSSQLLCKCPGIQPAIAFNSIKSDDLISNFQEERKKLFRKLDEIKAMCIPQTIIPRHGITAECPHSGYSMEVWCNKLPQARYISSVSNAKIEASEKAKEKIEEILKKCNLSNKYTITDDIEKLGQREGEDSHIAIVHIDGNGTGEKFMKTKSLIETRNLSISLKKATLESFKELLKQIDTDFKNIEKEFNISKENGKKILPIRPIVIGGDDITFVCEGSLGIYFALIYLRAYEKQNGSDKNALSACAGVSIAKTKYPFYRSYQLSEELLKNAKDERRNKNDNGSWLDFHLSQGAISGSIDKIRERYFKVHQGKLCLRPYKISELELLLKCASEIMHNFPHSKIMDLRRVLYLDEDAGLMFIEEMKQRGRSLPKFQDFRNDSLFTGMKTPYFDMIELIELYPQFAF